MAERDSMMEGATPDDSPMSSVMDNLVNRLEEEAKKRVGQRRLVEERWLQDIAQYEGMDESVELAARRSDGRSDAVVNLTRPKCNTFESKLFDMLFPTDDKNWGIAPTPVPERDLEATRLTGDAERRTAEANLMEDAEAAEQARGEADQIAQAVAGIEAERQEARQQSELMSAEIEDNLTECEYAQECRKVIHDATVAGTGILKGPIPLNERVTRNWHRDEAGKWRLRHTPENEGRFAYQHVSYWNLFPDTPARDFNIVESWMERHILLPRDLRELANQQGVNVDAIRRLLEEGPQETLPTYLKEVDAVTEGEQQSRESAYYILWEYRGPLEKEEMEELVAALAMDDEDEEGPSDVTVEMDPLISMDATVLFCQGEIIKMGINHMDDNSSIYSVFQIEKSVARLWQVGVPYLMRTQQNILSDSWRHMLDNAEWGAFPIIEIDQNIVQPAQGNDYRIRPGEVFLRSGTAAGQRGIYAVDIPIHQEHYAAIIQLATQFTDQETNVSIIASGEQGAHTTGTAGGMALLMNSVNVVFRRVVKNWDDGITSSAITKAYYFLMQFSPREEIKGDYAVKARGSDVLLVREVQAQNLLLLASQMAVHPDLGRYFNMREILKKLLQSMLISSDVVLKTVQELEADAAAEAEAMENAPPDPAMVKLQLDQQNAERQAELTMAEIEAKERMLLTEIEADLTKMAAQGQITITEAQARLQGVREKIMSDERKQAQEAAIETRRDQMGVARGSGGTF